MKLLLVKGCGDCPNMTWMDLNYSVNCDLSGGSVRFKEIGSEEALSELFKDCPLEEYSNSEIKLLNAFLVHKGLAEEYIRWKKDGG